MISLLRIIILKLQWSYNICLFSYWQEVHNIVSLTIDDKFDVKKSECECHEAESITSVGLVVDAIIG